MIQGTYEIFMRIAERHFGNSLAGRFILTAGLGGMGGAQPLAGRMAGAAILCVEIDPDRIRSAWAAAFSINARLISTQPSPWIEAARREGRATSIGLNGNAADIYEALLARGVIPDIVTDQTSAHDLVYGYVPSGRSLADVRRMREDDPAA